MTNEELSLKTKKSLAAALKKAMENKHIISCAYDSMGYEELKRFLYCDMNGLIYNTIQNGENKLGISIDNSFKEFLAKFYTEAAAGILIDWVKNRVSQDRETILQNLLLICRVSIPKVLKAKAQSIQ